MSQVKTPEGARHLAGLDHSDARTLLTYTNHTPHSARGEAVVSCGAGRTSPKLPTPQCCFACVDAFLKDFLADHPDLKILDGERAGMSVSEGLSWLEFKLAPGLTWVKGKYDTPDRFRDQIICW